MRPGTLLRWRALKNILKSKIKDGAIIFVMKGKRNTKSCIFLPRYTENN